MKINTITIKPDWSGQVAVCIGGGASLTPSQVNATKGLKTIAINDAYKLAPWADILYACDAKWWHWQQNQSDYKAFTGYKLQHISHNKLNNFDNLVEHEDFQKIRASGAPYPNIDCIVSSGENGFDHAPDRIRHGHNSGYQALHVAMHKGAGLIILIGYDMHANGKSSHWFGEHPAPFNHQNPELYEIWKIRFDALQEAALNRGQTIINCTPGSALNSFKKMKLQELGL